MATTDSKLYRIFLVAGEQNFPSRADLSKEIAKRRYDEFSYEEENVTHYLTWKGVVDYVNFATMIGLLDGELRPYIETVDVTRDGFHHALGQRVESFAEGAGFSEKRIRTAMRELLSKQPIQLPSPKAVYQLIKPTCQQHVFTRAINVQAFQARTRLFVKHRQSFFAEDTLRE